MKYVLLFLSIFATSAFAFDLGGDKTYNTAAQTNLQAVGVDVSNRITNDSRSAAASFAAGGQAFAAGGTAVSGGGQGGVGQAVSGGSNSNVDFNITSPKNTPAVFSGNVYPTAPCMGSSTVGGAGVGFGFLCWFVLDGRRVRHPRNQSQLRRNGNEGRCPEDPLHIEVCRCRAELRGRGRQGVDHGSGSTEDPGRVADDRQSASRGCWPRSAADPGRAMQIAPGRDIQIRAAKPGCRRRRYGAGTADAAGSTANALTACCQPVAEAHVQAEEDQPEKGRYECGLFHFAPVSRLSNELLDVIFSASRATRLRKALDAMLSQLWRNTLLFARFISSAPMRGRATPSVTSLCILTHALGSPSPSFR